MGEKVNIMFRNGKLLSNKFYSDCHELEPGSYVLSNSTSSIALIRGKLYKGFTDIDTTRISLSTEDPEHDKYAHLLKFYKDNGYGDKEVTITDMNGVPIMTKVPVSTNIHYMVRWGTRPLTEYIRCIIGTQRGEKTQKENIYDVKAGKMLFDEDVYNITDGITSNIKIVDERYKYNRQNDDFNKKALSFFDMNTKKYVEGIPKGFVEIDNSPDEYMGKKAPVYYMAIEKGRFGHIYSSNFKDLTEDLNFWPTSIKTAWQPNLFVISEDRGHRNYANDVKYYLFNVKTGIVGKAYDSIKNIQYVSPHCTKLYICQNIKDNRDEETTVEIVDFEGNVVVGDLAAVESTTEIGYLRLTNKDKKQAYAKIENEVKVKILTDWYERTYNFDWRTEKTDNGTPTNPTAIYQNEVVKFDKNFKVINADYTEIPLSAHFTSLVYGGGKKVILRYYRDSEGYRYDPDKEPYYDFEIENPSDIKHIKITKKDTHKDEEEFIGIVRNSGGVDVYYLNREGKEEDNDIIQKVGHYDDVLFVWNGKAKRHKSFLVVKDGAVLFLHIADTGKIEQARLKADYAIYTNWTPFEVDETDPYLNNSQINVVLVKGDKQYVFYPTNKYADSNVLKIANQMNPDALESKYADLIAKSKLPKGSIIRELKKEEA